MCVEEAAGSGPGVGATLVTWPSILQHDASRVRVLDF